MPIISPKIPSGLEELMRGLAKSVIKENPQNIYEFAAEYFENLLKERDGSVDQSYKKFATYKVYKKNKTERLKREKKNSNDVNEKIADNGLIKDGIAVNYENQKDFQRKSSTEEKSIEEVILPSTAIPQAQSEPDANESIEQVQDVTFQAGNTEDDDIANMVLDEDMEQAALKIQSTFRGHKVRRDMKEPVLENAEEIDENVNDEMEIIDEPVLEIASPDALDDVENEFTANELDVVESEIDQMPTEEEEQSEQDIDSSHVEGQIQSEVDDDIANMVFDDDMEQAAIKIQSTFRGLQTRREMKQSSIEKGPAKEESLTEETNDQPDESDVAQSDEPENIGTNDEPLDDETEKETNLQSEQSVHVDEGTEKEEIDDQKIENESKIDTIEEVKEETVEAEIISPEMATEVAERDTEESVIDTEAQSVEVELNSSELANGSEAPQESCEVESGNLDDLPESTIKDVAEQAIDEVLNEAEKVLEINKFDDVENSENVEAKNKQNLNELSTEIENGKTDEIEAEEILPTVEAEETEKEEIGEQEILETENDLDATAVTQQSSIEESKLDDEETKKEEAETKEEETLLQEVDEKAIVESHEVEKLENKSSVNEKEHEEINDVTCTEELEETVVNLNCEEIELAENIESLKVDEKTVNEEEICDNNPQENEPIKEKDAEVNEQEPSQEDLNENENGNVGDIEATETLDKTNDDDYVDKTPVIEEICVKKSIENLEPDQENIESEIIETKNSLNEIENCEENVEEISTKLPSGDIEYSTLKESISEPAESADEADNKSQDVTDEKSIDGDTTGSKPNSFDEIQDEINEQSPLNENQGENVIHLSTVDDEMNATHEVEEPEKGSDEAAINEAEAVESILQPEISPIELMDEVVNEYAGAVAKELFSENIDELEHEKGLIKSLGDEDKENPNVEAIHPKLSEENPLQEIETQNSIDLTQENVQVSQDEQQPIADEILQPEKEDSEIPEEESQVPVDENITVASLEEDVPAVESDEQKLEVENLPPPPKVEDDVSDMVLDEEMEDAALKIQAAFRGHQVRKEHVVQQKSENVENVDDDNESENVEVNVVIDQCSDENQETEEQEEVDQQDTSADVEQIQDSETVDQEQTEEETHEEENIEEETAVESVENDTAEQVEDDPNGTPDDGAAESSEQPNNDDDDVANMVLDEEMEQAALKIQSTFRGHKTRQDMKKGEPESEASASSEPQEQKDPVQDVDDDIANMVLDGEMEQAALKIQSTFRGHKTRKDMKKDDETDNEDNEEKPEEKKEDEPPKEEEASQSSSTDKSAKQLQEEEDIANLVMDAEMEQTALKIQSAFRGKSRKKAAKDGDDSQASSSVAQSDEDEEEEIFVKSDDDPFQENLLSQEEIGNGEKSSDEKGSDNAATQYSPPEDVRYSIECQNTNDNYNPIALNSSIDDLHLMQGGGIFPEPSGESSDMLTSSSGDDRDPDRPMSYYDKTPSNTSHEIDEPISEKNSVDPLNDKDVIENFDFVANKDTAEAMYYSLRKNELETQRQRSAEKQLSVGEDLTEDEQTMSMEKMTDLENQSMEFEEEDDDDVVVRAMQPSSAKRLKYGMSMDDRLLGSILSQDYSSKARKGYPDDGFDPLLEATMRNHQFLEKLHEISNSDEDKNISYINDYPGDDEDQFDDFYNSSNIRQKMLASSISIADSDFFDPTNNKSMIDDDKIRTAIDKLETIPSSDSESTIASAATKIQAGDRINTGRNITSHNMQYSSIGNAAIDRSLDEFIQSQELRIDRFDEEMEGYNSPPPRMQESVDEWTDETTYTDSEKKVGSGGVIEIKLEQKSFLTVDERRRTLHREDAIQRNSTREDEDSSKSSNVSGEKLTDKNTSVVGAEVLPVTQQDSVIDTEIAVPVLDLTAKSKSSSVAQVKPQKMKRQHTMPVQIQTDVIRVIPKHLRKRIKSAEDEKKKRVSK